MLRAIKSGKISAARNEHGEWQIEPAEVHRVYPAVRRNDAEEDAKQQYAPPAAIPFDAQISAMRDVADLLRTQLDDVRKDRDHWRSQAETIARQISHGLTPPRQPSRAPAWLLWTVGILIGAVTLGGAKALSGWVL